MVPSSENCPSYSGIRVINVRVIAAYLYMPVSDFENVNTGTCEYWTVLLFSKLNKTFFGYFDPENIFLDNKNK